MTTEPMAMPKRLGQPSSSPGITIVFVSQSQRPPTPQPPPYVPGPPVDVNPMRWKVPNGEDTRISISADKSSYGWDETAIIKAKATFASDNAPLIGRYLWFVIASRNIVGGYDTKVVKTDSGGVATIYVEPWGLPADVRQGYGYNLVAKFDGY